MKPVYLSLLVGALALLAFSSCEVINPEEEIPSYIRIETVEVTSDIPSTGTTQHKVSDVWVFINDDLLGAFELPITLPVLEEGRQKITIFAGVLDNGIQASRSIYPFFTEYEISPELVRDSVILIEPVVEHRSPDVSTYFWIEDFEDISLSLDTLPESTVDLVRTTEPDLTFEGNGSAVISVSPDNPVFSAVTNSFFALPLFGPQVYMEMHYSNSVNFTVGANINSPENGINDQTFITLRPTIDDNGELFWNKVYLNITSLVNQDPTAQSFQIAFGANVELTGETGEIYLDNIKLIAQ